MNTQERTVSTGLDVEKKVNKRDIGLEIAIVTFREKLPQFLEKEMQKNFFVYGGREYPITSHIDCMLANSQARVRAVEEFLKGVIGHDYFLEQTVAEELEILEDESKLVAKYASLLMKTGVDIGELQKRHPAITYYLQEGKDRWYTMQSK